MAAALVRCLLVREREIPAQRSDEYRAAWTGIMEHATAGGAHAWVFRSATADGRFIEFVEWPAGTGEVAGPGEAPAPPAALAVALDQLDAIAPPLNDSTWKEWKTT